MENQSPGGRGDRACDVAHIAQCKLNLNENNNNEITMKKFLL